MYMYVYRQKEKKHDLRPLWTRKDRHSHRNYVCYIIGSAQRQYQRDNQNP